MRDNRVTRACLAAVAAATGLVLVVSCSSDDRGSASGALGPDGAAPDAVTADSAVASTDADVPKDGAGSDGGPRGTPCGSPKLGTDVGDGGVAIVDVGHAEKLTAAFRSGDRAVTVDVTGHWNVWDVASTMQLANGGGFVDGTVRQRGNVFVARTQSAAEVRDTRDGRLMFTLPAAAYADVGVADDGSYVWATSASGITAWSPAGTSMFTRTGDYATAAVFAANDEVDVAAGPAGANVVERLAVPAGTPSVSAPFSGTFKRWFTDRSRLITTGSGVQRAYDRTGTLLATFAASDDMYGTGDRVWIPDVDAPGIAVYEIASPSTATTLSSGYVSPNAVFLPLHDGVAFVLTKPRPGSSYLASFVWHADLSGASPVADNTLSPITDGTAYGFESGRWITGNWWGEVAFHGVTSDPKRDGFLGCGRVSDLAGTGSVPDGGARAVIGLARDLLVVDTSATPAIVTHDIPSRGAHVELSRDGRVLAAAEDTTHNRSYYENDPDQTLRVLALPAATEIHAFPATSENPPGPNLIDFSLAGGGGRIARTERTNDYRRSVTDVSGGMSVFEDTGRALIALSPDGSAFAAPTGADGDGPCNPQLCASMLGGSTRFYKSGALVNGVPGFPVGFIDDNRVLVKTYKDVGSSGIPNAVYDGSKIYDAMGNVVAASSVPELWRIDVVGPNRVFDRKRGRVFDLTTGEAMGGPGTTPSAAAGKRILSVRGHLVVEEPLP